MSLIPYSGSSLIPFEDDILSSLQYHAQSIYYWLRDVAPTLLKYQLIQLGRDGIDGLPFLSNETKREVKRWFDDFHRRVEQEVQEWMDFFDF